jgi:hypothetical protein
MGQGEEVEGEVLKKSKKRNFWVLLFLCDFSWKGEEKDEESW